MPDISRRRFSQTGLLVGLAMLLGLLFGEPSALGRTTGSLSGGHLDLSCAICHDTSGGALDPAALGPATAQDTVCAGCHEGAREASHPVGFVPTRNLPETFPLDGAGEMTCSTCHDPHGNEPKLLRPDLAAEGACLNCHNESFFLSMTDGGHSLMKRAHLDASGDPWSLLDPYSRQCLVCHDDKGAGAAQVASLAPISGHETANANHPIGRSYSRAAEYGGYRPIFDLAQEVLLPGGKVGCVSCHQPYSQRHGRTAPTRAGLCVECHTL